MINFIFSLLLLLGGDCTKFDLIILCDYSGSIKGHENTIATAVNVFSKGLYVGEEDIKLGIVVFSGGSDIFCPLTTDTVKLNKRLETLYSLESMTNTDLTSGLLSCYDEFKIRGREDVPRAIIIISDGMPDRQEESLLFANQLKLMDIKIFSLLIDASLTDESYMEKLSSPNAYFNTNYQILLKTLQNINFCL